MIERYTRPQMQAVWDAGHRLEVWLRVESLVCEALVRTGEIPASVLDDLTRVRIDRRRMDEIESVVKHDVIAFLTMISEQIGPQGRYLHLGLTSSDIVDTALAVLMVEAADLILTDVEALLDVLRRRAYEFKDTVMVGRSHGIHGEPITFGVKLALWYDEMRRNRERLRGARSAVAVGKLSGAMGTFAHLAPTVEAHVCERLGLRPAPVSSQIVARDLHAEFLGVLALLAGSIEKIAVELRHLQRTEVLEAEEAFASGQKGSSAMPHKRNPISAENLSGLARVVRANAGAALEDIPLWHERDISHSSVERIVLPDSTILIDYMLARLTGVLSALVVYPDNMRRNLDQTGGLIFSQRLLLELAKRGVSREAAYAAVQGHAMAAWRGDGRFADRIARDPLIAKQLTAAEIEDCFQVGYYLRHVDTIFERVFDARETATGRPRG